MSQQDLLIRVIERLEQTGIEYMLTGSVVSSFQGEPRATHDIDVVIAVRTVAAEAAKTFKAAFPEPDYFLDEDAARNAILAGPMFNLIDMREGDKVDFWLLTEEEFDRTRFARREAVPFEGVKLVISRPEDTILGKLKWSVMSGGSEKQFNDALRVYEVQYGNLDHGYLDTWAVKLDVADLLLRLREQAEQI